MSITKITKQTKTFKGSRILSTTLVFLCVVGLLTYSFSESAIYPVDILSKDDGLDLFSTGKNMVGNHNVKFMKEEVESNSLKVEEQISTIIGEMNLMSATTTRTHQPEETSIHQKSFDAEKNFKEIINTSPVVLFIRSSEPESNYLRGLLTKEYEMSPEMVVVDLDKHVQGHILQNYIKNNQLNNFANDNGATEVPYLFINGVSVINDGLKKDIVDLHSNNQLLTKLRTYSSDRVLFQKKGMPSNS